MKKTIIIISILLIAALVASLWVYLDTFITKKMYPIEYSETVETCAKEYSVPKELVYAVIKTESNFKSDAVSNKNAIGLMQIQPDTYEWLCQKNSDTENDPNLLYKPEVNIKYGVYYLDMLYSEFGSWETALAAYNAGPANVRKWLENPEYSQDGVLVNIPFEETKNYVEKVMKAKETYVELYFEEK